MARPLLLAALLAVVPATALAAPGYVVCMGVEDGAQGRVVVTAQPFSRDSGRTDGDAAGFARAAREQGKTAGALDPACHWEPSREKAADYMRRLKQGAGRKGADAVEVAFIPTP